MADAARRLAAELSALLAGPGEYASVTFIRRPTEVAAHLHVYETWLLDDDGKPLGLCRNGRHLYVAAPSMLEVIEKLVEKVAPRGSGG